MPRQRIGDIEIYYEIHGDGPQTLVMIRGLGSNLTAWYEQTPEFARHFRTVIFDNRGAGRTDKPDAPYSLSQMAGETAGLMDALGVRRAALLGISMGGMIAQEFALAHQDRLACLILGCTTFGGAEAVRAAPEVMAALVAGEKASAEQKRIQQRSAFTDHAINHRREIIEKHERVRMQYLIPPFAYQRQIEAVMKYDVSKRLGEIHVPTMVMAGRDDILVPPENSKLIAARIPGAKLVELPGGHLFFTEYPAEFNAAVIEFVRAHP
ncbi:MAG TPA: alpha/beta fold hydrolase [Candidatus Binataceae bacterium]|nr:alpha/beta fold hydrolase [Candidatus Binataceae bacterium]HVC44434.1 alpha/beta fold hydrolase [Candidatus Binataceae bacterium]